MTDLQELAEIEALPKVMARYSRFGDTQRTAVVSSLYLLSFSPAQAELASRQDQEMCSIACALANGPGTGQMWRCSSVTVCPGACLTKQGLRP